LEKAKSFIPDVILLDIGMPDLDGFETYTELRRDPRLSHVKIVALTAYANSTEKRHILEHGFDGFIGKPFKRDQLIETINQFAVSSAAP
jgi:CheY-like chemotaxis protein